MSINEQSRSAKVAVHNQRTEVKTARQADEAAVVIEEICVHDDPDATGPSAGLASSAARKTESQEEPEKLQHEQNKEAISRFIAQRYVRRDGKFYRVNNSGVPMSATDVKRACLYQVEEAFPAIEITDQLWSDVCQHAINDTHTARDQTIPVWNGTQACKPDVESHLTWDESLASLNTWRKPAYRSLVSEEADGALFEELLQHIFNQPADRTVFLDWLAWNLQNEGDKPAWSILLYSQSKGTGKSTLGRLLSLLFAPTNSMPLNGISKLTGRFNKSVLLRKFVTCEEVKLKAGTDAGNTVKALISEKEIAVEGKGTNTENIENVCVFLMTTNHFPHWIEPDDRRFYVIDVNHSGHASGPDREAFQDFMKAFYTYMEVPENLKKLYNYLLAHKPSNSFNPRALNVAAVGTPIMKRIVEASGEVLQQQLEEIIAASGRFAIPQADLVKLFSDKLKTNSNRIVHMMSELGWRPEKAKWGGIDYARAVWVHPDYQVARGRITGPDGYDEPVSQIEEEVELI